MKMNDVLYYVLQMGNLTKTSKNVLKEKMSTKCKNRSRGGNVYFSNMQILIICLSLYSIQNCLQNTNTNRILLILSSKSGYYIVDVLRKRMIFSNSYSQAINTLKKTRKFNWKHLCEKNAILRLVTASTIATTQPTDISNASIQKKKQRPRKKSKKSRRKPIKHSIEAQAPTHISQTIGIKLISDMEQTTNIHANTNNAQTNVTAPEIGKSKATFIILIITGVTAFLIIVCICVYKRKSIRQCIESSMSRDEDDWSVVY